MSMFPHILSDHDLDLATAGSLYVDPNDYEDYAINRALISADFEGSVKLRARSETRIEVAGNLYDND